MSDPIGWLKQPTTIHGLAALLAAGAGFGTYATTGSVEGASIAASIVYGAIHMVLPDNTQDQSSVEHFVQDAVKAVAEKRVASMLPALVADAHAAFLSNVGAAAVTPSGVTVAAVADRVAPAAAGAALGRAVEAAQTAAALAPVVGEVEAAIAAVHPTPSAPSR